MSRRQRLVRGRISLFANEAVTNKVVFSSERGHTTEEELFCKRGVGERSFRKRVANKEFDGPRGVIGFLVVAEE